MPLLEILTAKEKKLFDSPPHFSSNNDRKIYFKLDEEINKILGELRGKTNKIGFILQLGYFRCTGKFYLANEFHKKDLIFVADILGLPTDVDIADYSSSSYLRHQKLILEYLGYAKFDKIVFAQEVERLVNKYIRPKQIIVAISESFKGLKIELPRYYVFAEAITTEYNKLETVILEKIKTQLTEKQIEKINSLLPNVDENEKEQSVYRRSILNGLKHIKQSLTPKDIKFNIQNFIKVKNLYMEFKSIIDSVDLSKEAINYHAIWVSKARTSQIGQFTNIYKRALVVMSFAAYQYSFFQDILVDILLRSTQASLNNVEKLQKDKDFERRDARNNSIKLLAESSNKSRTALAEIGTLVNSPKLSDKNKVSKIKTIINKNRKEFNAFYVEEFNQLEQETENALKGRDYFDIMEKLSIKLQRRVSDIIKQLDFNLSNSNENIIVTIEYYKTMDGRIDNRAPIVFLDKNTIEHLHDSNGNIKISLYKSLLFINIADAIKSGTLNLVSSYRYLSIDDYLISKLRWKNEKKQLLERAGLLHLLNYKKIIKQYKKTLNDKYDSTNQNILIDKNPYIKFKEDGTFIVKTPTVDKLETAKVSSLFDDKKYIPIIQVLEAINEAAGFIDCFKHYAIKHNKPKPSANVFFAGIIALGCNIGIRKMANISIGISESTLTTACNWYFGIDDVNDANNQIIKLINKLSLPNLFVKQNNLLHLSGDGQKYVANADTLNANFSFKYNGNSQGVSVYTFIDERHILSHSLVISSSEREAGYVIDGLLCNEEIQADIFSTDTHGFSEVVFAIIELLGISFAPRIKKSQKQLLYSFETIQNYSEKGYKILPNRRINEKIISDNWDNILKLMVTIKLKETTASQILKRLSSYAKENPLHKALKEFGRIAKTIFLLTYFDDAALRQIIQKQLNKGELANKFSAAVFFDNNQEFSQTDKKDQEIAVSCKRLIQNAMILWNYLFLSKLLAEGKNKNLVEYDDMISIIINGSILNWGHFSMNGQYDFFEKSANEDSFHFDLEKILELKVA